MIIQEPMCKKKNDNTKYMVNRLKYWYKIHTYITFEFFGLWNKQASKVKFVKNRKLNNSQSLCMSITFLPYLLNGHYMVFKVREEMKKGIIEIKFWELNFNLMVEGSQICNWYMTFY